MTEASEKWIPTDPAPAHGYDVSGVIRKFAESDLDIVEVGHPDPENHHYYSTYYNAAERLKYYKKIPWNIFVSMRRGKTYLVKE